MTLVSDVLGSVLEMRFHGLSSMASCRMPQLYDNHFLPTTELVDFVKPRHMTIKIFFLFASWTFLFLLFLHVEVPTHFILFYSINISIKIRQYFVFLSGLL